MFQRTLLLASAAAIAASVPAFAGSIADPIYQAAPAAPVAYSNVHNWAGGYLGVNLGYGGDKAKHPFSITDGGDTLGGSLDITSGGFVGGVQAGYNFQNGRMVYGIEGDLQASGLKGETSANLTLPGGGPTISGEIGTKLKSYATLRARVGHAVTDTFLVYATAGVATGKTETYASGRVSGGGPALSESFNKTKTGWTVGIGAEYAFQNNWSLKSEYMYTDLGKANLYSGDLGGLVDAASLDRKLNFHTVRVGLNYKF